MLTRLLFWSHEWTNGNGNLVPVKLELNGRSRWEGNKHHRMEIARLKCKFPGPKLLCTSRGRLMLWRIYLGLRVRQFRGDSRWDAELGFDFVESVRLVSSTSLSPFPISYWGNLTEDKSLKMALNGPRTTQNRQVHAKQEVSQLYFIIHNNIIYFWEIEWIPIQSLIITRYRSSHTITKSLYMHKSRSATVNTNCKLGLPVNRVEFQARAAEWWN